MPSQRKKYKRRETQRRRSPPPGAGSSSLCPAFSDDIICHSWPFIPYGFRLTVPLDGLLDLSTIIGAVPASIGKGFPKLQKSEEITCGYLDLSNYNVIGCTGDRMWDHRISVNIMILTSSRIRPRCCCPATGPVCWVSEEDAVLASSHNNASKLCLPTVLAGVSPNTTAWPLGRSNRVRRRPSGQSTNASPTLGPVCF